MSYNTGFTRFKSSGLAGLDCGSYLKVPRRDEDITITEVYDGDIEVGQCVAMIRVPAGARITGADLSWGNGSGTAILAVGDPYACGRLLGPISTARNRGQMNKSAANAANDCVPFQAWGTCGKLMRTGSVGDGCGLFYQYTCETDIILTSLYHSGYANLGGWQGAALPDDCVGAKWTGGRIVLTVSYKQAS
jgi:hypothetical protein